jgi:hypothetical protein
MSIGEILRAFLRPEIAEVRAVARRTWDALPESVKLPEQVLGRAGAGCAATYGVIERCNFACTACYLAEEANPTPPLPFAEVARQLDLMRAHLGPWGNAQITSGEVTLLPCEELVRILRYARSIELSPMVVSNGSILLEDPAYLERLVVEGGLENLAIHVDVTQRGRRGLVEGMGERDLMPLRERFADLVRATRSKTGRRLDAAHTVTVTDENIGEVADVVRWALRNADAFRMLSFLPTAEVGRTTARKHAGGRERLWTEICRGLGVRANEHPWHLGHPSCSSVVLAFVVQAGGDPRVVEVTRAEKAIDRWFLRRLIRGGLAGWRPGGEPRSVAIARLLGRIARHPRFLLEIPAYALYRAASETRLVLQLLARLVTLRRFSVRPFILVVHHFMDAAELETDEGKLRLDACAFRLPIDGRMVPMCELNGSGLRKQLNLHDQARLAPRRKRMTVT